MKSDCSILVQYLAFVMLLMFPSLICNPPYPPDAPPWIFFIYSTDLKGTISRLSEFFFCSISLYFFNLIPDIFACKSVQFLSVCLITPVVVS